MGSKKSCRVIRKLQRFKKSLFDFQTHNDLVSKLEENDFQVVESQSFNDELTNQLDILKSKDIRIILGNFNSTWAK